MVESSRLRRVVENNAHWCDALARAHGAATELRAACWINHGAAPPYTPQLITLAGPDAAAEQLAAIERLRLQARGQALHVKDSYACLELAALGFELLFDATWISAPELLRRPDLHFLAGRREREVAAIAALNRSGTVVGLSNAIGPERDAQARFAACLTLARDFHPGVEVAGYERGAELAAAERAGFTPLHPLRVWCLPAGR